jgi:UDP-N-acetylmuramyl pentapeptide phosphotransferase/UDP-N-acetylglucosamine-1-phosphate transferase
MKPFRDLILWFCFLSSQRMLEIISFGTALAATIAGVAVFRRHGKVFATYDVPNERSSHTSPTLRGGGLIIVAVCLLLYIAAWMAGAGTIHWAFISGAVIVAAVSWIDDTVSLPAWVRFVAHSAAAVILIVGSGAVTGLYVPGYGAVMTGPVISQAITFLWIVWLINAYNFMDGIDGIAGAQGVVAGIGWAALGAWTGDAMIYIFAGVVAFSSLGFLVHNWSPARVFMGDVGSAFLGYTFAAMPLIADKREAGKSAWVFTAAISFVWLFIFDTLFTFVRRLLKKEKVWLAHRQHLYQRMVISGCRHSSVALVYAVSALLVVAAYLAAFVFGGILVPLLFFIYSAVPLMVTFLAFRKKNLT